MKEEKIIVKNAKSERKYFKTYYDFLYNELLNGDEKLIFITLKSFLDFSKDKNGTNGEAFPTIQTICHITQWSNKKVIKIINNLVAKGVVKKIQRGLNKPNLYILSDYEEIWKAKNTSEVKEIIENNEEKSMTAEEHIAALKKMGYDIEIKKTETMETKEKEPEITEPTKVTENSSPNSSNEDNIIPKSEKSQELERYNLDQIHQLFDYNIMLIDYPDDQQHIDSVMNILYTTMNTKKNTIKIAGENKPTMVVIGKLMKLNKESIIYVIRKFSKQTERIKNPLSYMLTMLYNAPEQFDFDIQNLAIHNMAHWHENEKIL